jgi:predicted Fe-Mo cluster-binding NifX family protein
MYMKIAIVAEGETLDALVAERFGRAPVLLFIDCETQAVQVVTNEVNLQAAQGAGLQTAERIVRAGATALLTRNCGPKAFKVLATSGIVVHQVPGGTAREALASWSTGELPEMAESNRAGHD